MNAVKLAATVLWVLWLIRAGFRAWPGMLSWPMFSTLSFCRLAVSDSAEEAGKNSFNQWDWLLHADIGMTRLGLEDFLTFLRDEEGRDLDGIATLIDQTGDAVVRIRNTRVVE